jgi:hypothetical protein
MMVNLSDDEKGNAQTFLGRIGFCYGVTSYAYADSFGKNGF